MKILFCVYLFLFIGGCEKSMDSHKEMINKEEVAVVKNVQTKSDLSIPNLNGQMINFSEMKGKKIVLNFWATWCPPCKEEMKDLETFYQNEMKKKEGVILIGINLTKQEWSQGSVASYVANQKLTFPIGLDIDGQMAEKYQIQALPTTVILDGNLNVLSKHVGPLTLKSINELMVETE
jgi:cytochrome c biogenesis protein CcmG/thiol:disulfide interchange protein DsbE